ncbi:MAG: phosphoglycerate kinase [Patescibacteria group bacterium]
MQLNTIDKADVRGKRVLLRVDFNVSTFAGKITDDFRIKHALPTIEYLLENEAKVIIASHFGRPPEDSMNNIKEREKFSMRPIAECLAQDLRYPVEFVSDCVGEEAEKAVERMKTGDILVLENLRFHQGEEANDSNFAAELAKLADVYVNDAFSVSHRSHASVSAIASFLPSYAGFLLAKEVEILRGAYENPKKPLVMAVGGGKIETKIKLIKRFFDKSDNILLGGIVGNFVLHAKGIAIGKSQIGKNLEIEADGLDWTSPKLHLPVDVIVADEISENARTKKVGVGKVGDDEIILDIGPDTIELFSEVARSAGTIIWNGPLGFSELPNFAEGTAAFAKAVAESNAFKVIGGGDSIAVIDKLGLSDRIDFISTGGGAMLEFLSGEPMPGIEALIKRHEK